MLCDINIPKFVDSDIQLFKSICFDLFPESQLPSIQQTSVQEKIAEVGKDLKVVIDAEVLQKVI